jgi:hypothetical protein
MVLSIAASHVVLAGSTDLDATQAHNMMTARALREFASGTLILLPQVPGIHQIASECSHPHRLRYRLVRTSATHVHAGKPSWPHPFWAARRLRDVDHCNAVLQPIKGSVVH